MILCFELERREDNREARHNFISVLEEREAAAAALTNIVFSKRKLSLHYEAKRVFILYCLEPSLPPVYLAGWLLMLFFMALGLSWVWWLWPLLFGLTGVFYTKPWFEFMFKIAMRKAGVDGKRVSLEYFVLQTDWQFREAYGVGAD